MKNVYTSEKLFMSFGFQCTLGLVLANCHQIIYNEARPTKKTVIMGGVKINGKHFMAEVTVNTLLLVRYKDDTGIKSYIHKKLEAEIIKKNKLRKVK